MCTSIIEITPVGGMGKGPTGWFSLTTAVVSYDHPHYAELEDAINIDFLNPALSPSARVAVEIPLGSARALLGALQRAVEAAEAEERAAEAWRTPKS